MYAVIRTGSKQYRVSPGDVITVEKLDVAEGKKYNFDDVVLVNDDGKVIVSPKELAKVRVSAKVVEGNRERIQVFEGTVMRLRGGGITRTITVRRIASGVGVERTFKVNSPRIEKIDVVRHGQVRRAQLYFLRKRVGKAASLRERRPS